MRVKVDLKKCTKSGECYYNHPELFKVDSEGFPVIQVDPLDSEDMQDRSATGLGGLSRRSDYRRGRLAGPRPSAQ